MSSSVKCDGTTWSGKAVGQGLDGTYFTSCGFSGGQVQTGVGVRGNASFAERQSLQKKFDENLSEWQTDGEYFLGDHISSCGQLPANRETGSWCRQWKNLGHADMTMTQPTRTKGVSPAFRSKEEAAVDPTGLGPNWPMRMSNKPVFFDATDTGTTTGPSGLLVNNAANYLSEHFYALHKAWGGLPNHACCGPLGSTDSQCRPTTYPADTLNAPGQDLSQAASQGCFNDPRSNEGGVVSTEQKRCEEPTAWFNGGCRKENIYFADRLTDDADATKTEQVLCLRFQGDKATMQKNLSEEQMKDPATAGTLGIPALGMKVNLSKSDIYAKLHYGAVPYPEPGSAGTMGTDHVRSYKNWGGWEGIPDSKESNMENLRNGCETCVVYPNDAQNARRVGACLVTADNFSSGLFEVYARVPPGNEYEYGGMGYTFASWTFHYSENYPMHMGANSDVDDPAKQRMDANLVSEPTKTPHQEHMFDGTNRFSCGLFSMNCDSQAAQCNDFWKWCRVNDGPFTVWNHEIDIEIPSNSARLPQVNTSQPPVAGASFPKDPTGGTCTWMSDTINFNTWLSDDQDYWDASPYRNIGVRRMNVTNDYKAPLPSPPPSSKGDPTAPITMSKSENADGSPVNTSFIATSRGDFHWYGFIWHSGSDNVRVPGVEGTKTMKPFIDFYVDRKFVQRVTDAFIPSRAGKLNIGPWFGWWGGKPNYDVSEVWIKYLNIVPFASVTDPVAPSIPAGAPPRYGGFLKNQENLTAAVAALNKAYLDGTASQDTPFAPLTFVEEDLTYSLNDINANQMFDQCGLSQIRNVCDYNRFLVVNKDVDASGKVVTEAVMGPGLVLAGPEPNDKCKASSVIQPPIAETVAQQWSVGVEIKEPTPVRTGSIVTDVATRIITNPYCSNTADRKQWYDCSVDPDPNVNDRIRKLFPKPFMQKDAKTATLMKRNHTQSWCQGTSISPPQPSMPPTHSKNPFPSPSWSKPPPSSSSHAALMQRQTPTKNLSTGVMALIAVLVLLGVGAVVAAAITLRRRKK